MLRKIPSGEELRRQVDRLLDEIDPGTKQDWLENPVTQAVLGIFEEGRMEAFELLEDGQESDVVRIQLIAQAQILGELREGFKIGRAHV